MASKHRIEFLFLHMYVFMTNFILASTNVAHSCLWVMVNLVSIA